MRHLRKAAFTLLCLVIALLAGCIPVTTATIHLSGNCSEADLSQIEGVVEQLGFSRIWVEPANGGRYARTKRDGETVSGFETPLGTADAGFGISVLWKPTDGSLRVIFAERNTRFSDRGMILMNKLVDELRALYGDRVSIQS